MKLIYMKLQCVKLLKMDLFWLKQSLKTWALSSPVPSWALLRSSRTPNNCFQTSIQANLQPKKIEWLTKIHSSSVENQDKILGCFVLFYYSSLLFSSILTSKAIFPLDIFEQPVFICYQDVRCQVLYIKILNKLFGTK